MNPTHFINSIEMRSLVEGRGAVPGYLRDWIIELRVAVEEGNPVPFSREDVISWYEYAIQRTEQPKPVQKGVMYYSDIQQLFNDLQMSAVQLPPQEKDVVYSAEVDTHSRRVQLEPPLSLEEIMEQVSKAWYNQLYDRGLDGQYD